MDRRDQDPFSDGFLEIAKTSAEDMKKAPRTTTVARVDDITAAKNLILNWKTIPKE
jgi:glycine cleavage system protein P-like pyridoxal-binding family